jgi:hypothetical protein
VLGFLDPPLHSGPHNEVLLVNQAFNLVNVYLGPAPVGRIGVHAKEVLGLADRNALQVRVDEAITERRIEPKSFKVFRIGRRYGLRLGAAVARIGFRNCA